ncbi:MAG: type II toxin-antitoxin system RelE/ParE family toxin [Gammaproteobacteria bacterium]|nr:MAG: type II toxin-antitoxin system RelE/ParE family toxin [Gammaproteobacteria bacterium]
MNVKIDNKAIKDLTKIDKKIATTIVAKIEKLVDFPQIANIKKLKSFNPPFRLMVGNYRVLFDVEDNEIMVYMVRHRKNSYQ